MSAAPISSVAASAGDTATRQRRGFRPLPRRRMRIATGVALCAVAVGGNVLLYTSLDERTPVIQITSDVRAGQRIERRHVRVVQADLDRTVPALGAAQIEAVLGQYARVHLVSGSLLTAGVLQAAPLVSPGTSVVAVEARPARVPAGLRERSRVLVILPRAADAPFVTTGRVVARSSDGADAIDTDHVSIEVAESDAAVVAAADDVRLALLDPAVDPALPSGSGGA